MPADASSAIPPMPANGPRASGRVPLRFEDVTQDGRLVLESLPTALGPSVWRGLLGNDAGLGACFKSGVYPIVSRLILEGTPGPFSANGRVDAEGSYRLARADDGRIMLDVWADLYGPIGHTRVLPATGGDRALAGGGAEGDRALAGRVLSEHVFTRPFAPAGQRRVTTLDFEGAPAVTETRPASPSFESIARVPDGATLLESAPSLDPVPIVFGLCHTDGNMHVNSLAYLRVFEEAALRRFVGLKRGSALLGRRMDIAYRKPCFAGQIMHVAQQAYEHEGRLAVAAVLVDASAPEARPHVYVRMTFET